MKKTVLTFLSAVLSVYCLSADEGMWLINTIDMALEKKMRERGLELPAGEIYNADAPGAALSDAVVSLEFGCTGSIISSGGLMITNHHCAYSDVYSLSTPGHNYLEDGFWAMTSDQEIPVRGKKVYFLKRVIDVTVEAERMIGEARSGGQLMGMRKLGFLMEKKYSDETGYEAWFASMWSGSKYYIALYEVYEDVRLVAAPPVSIAAFGGDTDNWEWPQHKCDFALYRIYTAPDGSPAEYSVENVPLRPEKYLEISLDGYRPGDFTMVIGFPGRTDRYSSSYEVDFKERVSLPVSNRLRAGQMALVDKWMDSDPEVRLKYSDYYFSLSNVMKLNEGEVQCYRRFNVVGQKRLLEDRLQSWIMADPRRSSGSGGMLSLIAGKYSATEDVSRDIVWYRETLVRGTRFSRIVPKINILKSEVLKSRGITPHRSADPGGPSDEEVSCCLGYRFRGKDFNSVSNLLMHEYRSIDLRVERDLLEYAVRNFYENVDTVWTGDFQKALKRRFTDSGGGCDYGALVSWLWDSSFLTDTSRLHRFISEEHTLEEYRTDPVVSFFQDISIRDFNTELSELEGEPSLQSLSGEYTRALYRMNLEEGVPQYPDANSTMRISYGTVGSLEPYDGVVCSWRSTTDGIIEKYDPHRYEYTLHDGWKALLEEREWGRWGVMDAGEADGIPGSGLCMYADFLTDNDITGGNSGSPVLDARGRLIGLAFDGNSESLASESFYTPGYNKCVCVDIRFILWTLDRYAGMTHILEELGLR